MTEKDLQANYSCVKESYGSIRKCILEFLKLIKSQKLKTTTKFTKGTKLNLLK